MIKFARGSSDPRRRLVLARLPRGIPTIFQSRFEIIKMSSEKVSRSQDFSFDSSLVDFVSDRFSTVIEKSNRSFNLGRTFSISVDRSRKKFRITCREYVLKNSGGTCVKRKPFRMLFMGRFSQREGGRRRSEPDETRIPEIEYKIWNCKNCAPLHFTVYRLAKIKIKFLLEHEVISGSVTWND